MAKKKNEKKWLQVGNFLLGVEQTTMSTRLVVRSVAGDWKIMWEQGTMMYAVLLGFLSDEKTHGYLNALLTLQFAATNYPHDLVAMVEKQDMPLINGFTKLLQEQTDFEVSVKKAATPEEDEEALNEVAEMQDIQDKLEELDKENGEG